MLHLVSSKETKRRTKQPKLQKTKKKMHTRTRHEPNSTEDCTKKDGQMVCWCTNKYPLTQQLNDVKQRGPTLNGIRGMNIYCVGLQGAGPTNHRIYTNYYYYILRGTYTEEIGISILQREQFGRDRDITVCSGGSVSTGARFNCLDGIVGSSRIPWNPAGKVPRTNLSFNVSEFAAFLGEENLLHPRKRIFGTCTPLL